jgi:hypothetical protein
VIRHTGRTSGRPYATPVGAVAAEDGFVIAEGDVKLHHLARRPRCVPVVFETVRPFRGAELRGLAERLGPVGNPAVVTGTTA